MGLEKKFGARTREKAAPTSTKAANRKKINSTLRKCTKSTKVLKVFDGKKGLLLPLHQDTPNVTAASLLHSIGRRIQVKYGSFLPNKFLRATYCLTFMHSHRWTNQIRQAIANGVQNVRVQTWLGQQLVNLAHIEKPLLLVRDNTEHNVRPKSYNPRRLEVALSKRGIKFLNKTTRKERLVPEITYVEAQVQVPETETSVEIKTEDNAQFENSSIEQVFQTVIQTHKNIINKISAEDAAFATTTRGTELKDKIHRLRYEIDLQMRHLKVLRDENAGLEKKLEA